MKAESHRDRVVDEVTRKVTQRASVTAEEEVVRAKAEKAVDGLIDQPVQTFAPLLAENEVVSELHAESSDPETNTATPQ